MGVLDTPFVSFLIGSQTTWRRISTSCKALPADNPMREFHSLLAWSWREVDVTLSFTAKLDKMPTATITIGLNRIAHRIFTTFISLEDDNTKIMLQANVKIIWDLYRINDRVNDYLNGYSDWWYFTYRLQDAASIDKASLNLTVTNKNNLARLVVTPNVEQDEFTGTIFVNGNKVGEIKQQSKLGDALTVNYEDGSFESLVF